MPSSWISMRRMGIARRSRRSTRSWKKDNNMSGCTYKSLPDQKEAAQRSKETPRLLSSALVPEALASFASGKSYSIRTYGCQANIRDEEIFAGYLEKAGFHKAKSFEEADLVLINTCAVRENAEEKIYGEIGLCKARKEYYTDTVIAVIYTLTLQDGLPILSM